MRNTLGDHYAVFRQQSAYLIAQRSAGLHQLLPHSMHGLHVLLRSTLDRDETHRRSARGLADRLRVTRIVLIGEGDYKMSGLKFAQSAAMTFTAMLLLASCVSQKRV